MNFGAGLKFSKLLGRTFESLDVGCIVNNSDFGTLMHRSVPLLAGPLLRNSKGK